jgi:methylenetetrahydrofolate reductase (NADPH)
VPAREFSLEAVRPSAAELALLPALIAKGTPVYLSSVSGQSYRELPAMAAQLRKLGFEPVAHIAARRFASSEELQNLLARLRAEADMRRVLVIGGDLDTPAGPFDDALSVIECGKLREAGIEEVGVAGYPDGHPRIPADVLARVLDAKIAATARAGLRMHIVSQFSFDPPHIVAWLKQLRARGIAVPVKVGMAGPTSIPGLLRYARRCGVRASLHGLLSGSAAALLGRGSVGPDRILQALADAGPTTGTIAPHYFSFGGILQTAPYARDAAAGRNAAAHAINQ